MDPNSPHAPASPPVAAAPQKAPKTLILLIVSVILGVVLLIAIVVAVYLSLFHVSQQDYKNAANAVAGLQAAETKTTTALAGVQNAAGVTNNDGVAAAQTALSSLQSQTSQFKKQRALIDTGVKSKFDAYLAQETTFATYVSGLLVSYKQVEAATGKLQSINSDTSDMAVQEANYKQIAGIFTGLETVPNQDIATYAKAQAGEYSQGATIIQNYRNGDGSETTLAAQFNSILTSIESNSTTLTSAIKNHLKNYNPTDTLTALMNTIKKGKIT